METLIFAIAAIAGIAAATIIPVFAGFAVIYHTQGRS